ncbi:uncharacterized protein LOC105166467 isoform X1 [Sesamum indicum]|uniref:Uncharacterized protein LOC105166467 isoform X1 n=1 Tax=Sesamum indicum TaxID=4182 RepID=A0A6I9TGK4_SESIN|nr:uncharacterized protein LOC105166467 isoform X1 [Sesamum indicum]
MDSQDHKMTATGHEGHGVHLCHRCGWPFPNAHPSAKHRRAHKRVCGTIEGYKIIHSEEHDDHLAVSDDEHASDDDEHTPVPQLVKKNSEEFRSSSGAGEKSNRSEDDVFSDAVTEFSDSGISPRLEERFESVRGLDKRMEQKSVEGDLYRTESLKVDETVDKTEQLEDPTRCEEMSNRVVASIANNQSANVLPVTDSSAEAVSVELINGLQPDLIKSETPTDVNNTNEYGDGGILKGQSGHNADIQGEEDNLASVTLDSEGKISGPGIKAVETKEASHDKLVSGVVLEYLPPKSETLQNLDAPAESRDVADSAENSCSANTVGEIALAEVTHGNVGPVGENTLPEKSLLTTPSVKPDMSTQNLDATVSLVSPVDQEVSQNTILAGGENAGNFDASKGEECDKDGNQNGKLEVKATKHSDAVSLVSPVDKEIDQNTILAGDENAGNFDASKGEQCDKGGNQNGNIEPKATEHSDSFYSPAGKEVSQKTILSEGETAGNLDASKGEECDKDGKLNGNLEEKDKFSAETISAPRPADNTSTPEYDQATKDLKKDVDHCEETSNSMLFEAGNVKGEGASAELQVILDSTKNSNNLTDDPSPCEADSDAINLEESLKTELVSWDNGFEKCLDAENNDEKSQTTASLEDPVPPVVSELPNNIHMTSNVVRVGSVDTDGTGMELKDNIEVVASERTSELPISEESASLFTDSELLREKTANDNSCIADAAEVSTEQNHGGGVVELSENLESPAPRLQEDLTSKKFSYETSADVKETYTSEDVDTSKSVGIALSAEPASDGNVLASDKCSATPSLTEPVPSTLDSEDLCETSATADDKNIINVEIVTSVNSKCFHDKGDDKLAKQEDGVSAVDLSGSSSSRCDSLEGNCGSISALSSQSNVAVAETNSQSLDTLENNSHKHNTSTEEAHSDKSDVFEPPSFMTLVQSGGEGVRVSAASEIETVQNNHKLKSDALQAGWFPSITNVVNESEGRKNNEEVIAKITNWSPVKQHGPLKNLLNEVKSPNTKQVPSANEKDKTEPKDRGAVVTTVTSVTGPDTNKDMEEWNSPARYPIEVKKEKKKKGKSYWVPFVCCSSVHRDL